MDRSRTGAGESTPSIPQEETSATGAGPSANGHQNGSKQPQGESNEPSGTLAEVAGGPGPGAIPQVATFKVAELRAADYNPREISEEALAGLSRSIQRFGCVEPIVVNVRTKRPRVVGGHQRLKALEMLGIVDVLCVTVNVPPTEEKLLNVTLNNPEIQGTFTANLAAYLDELQSKLRDKMLLARLRLDKLRAEVAEKAKSEAFQFRPGESNLKPPEKGSPFWLKKTQIEKFGRYENFILDFSGGRDSTLALLWTVTHFKDRNIYPVFSDPGVEFPGMAGHIVDVCHFLGVEPVILKPKQEWWSWMLKERQWPSLIFRKCQTIFIHSVTKEFRRQFDKEKTLLLDGSRATQAVRGSKKSKTSPLGSLPDYPAYHPCFDLTDEKAAELLEQSGVPLWEGYERGFVRTACWCCPGQCGLQALALQENYPGLANDIRRWEDRLGPIRPLEDRKRDDGVKGRFFLDVVESGKKKREQLEKRKAKEAGMNPDRRRQ